MDSFGEQEISCELNLTYKEDLEFSHGIRCGQCNEGLRVYNQ